VRKLKKKSFSFLW